MFGEQAFSENNLFENAQAVYLDLPHPLSRDAHIFADLIEGFLVASV